MFTQYPLPYEYNALEPHIDALTMETHYSKHHATYTKTLNEAAQKAGMENQDILALLSSLDSIPDGDLRKTLRNNGGGYYNHNLYFSTLSPHGGGEPTGAFAGLLTDTFGSTAALEETLSGLALKQFGSGWAWLSANARGQLILSASPNQDNPIIEGTGNIPILGIDVWEHAYYLKYRNVRADYIKAFFRVVDWKAVAENYERVRQG